MNPCGVLVVTVDGSCSTRVLAEINGLGKCPSCPYRGRHGLGKRYRGNDYTRSKIGIVAVIVKGTSIEHAGETRGRKRRN
jgi:hypothetical protein